MFFVENGKMHTQHKLGTHFGCATQMYNQIPGDGVLKRNDLFLERLK